MGGFRGMVGGLLAVALLAGCAALESVEREEAERQVTLRAKSRWAALLEGDWPKGYAFNSAASQKTFRYEDFVRTAKVGFWQAAEVKAVNCSARESCWVDLEVKYRIKGMSIATPIRETWVLNQGEWFYVVP